MTLEYRLFLYNMNRPDDLMLSLILCGKNNFKLKVKNVIKPQFIDKGNYIYA